MTSRRWPTPTRSIDNALSGLTERARSLRRPCLRNLGDQPANGPKSSQGFLLMIRRSRCGAVIAGAPGAGNPYTFGPMRGGERWVAAAQKLPTDREPAEALHLFDARLLQQRQRMAPAPTNTNFALSFWFSPPRRLRIVNVQLPSR